MPYHWCAPLLRWWKVKQVRKSVYTIIAGCGLLVLLHWLIKLESLQDEALYFESLPIPHEPNFVPFGIKQIEKLPTSGPLQIPKRIHQTWSSDKIPRSFQLWIRSWTKNHPDWEYWLWTDDDARKLIAEKYPALLKTYNNYLQPIRRADALRYVVLYEYGGIYADMDMESLKPMDPLARKYACFVGQEPYEHSIMDTNFENLVINALIGCRNGHPFLKMLIDSLADFSHMWSYLDSTGPHFVTYVYQQYIKTFPYYKPDHANGIYLTPAEYFYPSCDPDKFLSMYYICLAYENLGSLQRRACQNLKRTKPQRKKLLLAFANHHWIHTYLSVKVSLSWPVPINRIVPSVKMYSLYQEK